MTDLLTAAVLLIPIAALLVHHLRVRPRKVLAIAIEMGWYAAALIAAMWAALTLVPGTAPLALQLLAGVSYLAVAGLLSPIMTRRLTRRLTALDAAHKADHQGER